MARTPFKCTTKYSSFPFSTIFLDWPIYGCSYLSKDQILLSLSSPPHQIRPVWPGSVVKHKPRRQSTNTLFPTHEGQVEECQTFSHTRETRAKAPSSPKTGMGGFYTSGNLRRSEFEESRGGGMDEAWLVKKNEDEM